MSTPVLQQHLPWHTQTIPGIPPNIEGLECSQFPCAAIGQARVSRPDVDLFSSKLTVIQWIGPSECLEYLPFLITSTLQIFILQVQSVTMNNLNSLDVFFKTIPLRSPFLRGFKFSLPPADSYAQAISRSLGELFSLLPELVSILFSSHYMTKELFTTLSQLPQLQDLSLIYWAEFWSDDKDVGNLPKREIDDDEEAGNDIPFRSLRKAKISISDFNFMITEVLRRDIQLLKLIDLTYSVVSPDRNFDSFFEPLHRICPNLKKISIPDVSLPFRTIRSLLKCPALVEIVSDGDVDMELEDIVTIAMDRSSWKVIILQPMKPLSYQALAHFTQNCPDLYELGLTLDPKLRIPDRNTFPTDIKFSSLTSLLVGFSELAPDFELAFFLSRIFSKPIKVRARGSETNCRLWKTLEELVNFIVTSQLKIRALEDENMLLRTQQCNNDT
ncbi:hypothetical protein Clacol_002115 [Clathrus columnatus]|uniref:Uncharacterized protein n=1 Tax=Clathrus columnatus TaxID=1419009 RepID=A0AAV5A3S9_9AGAM|nr:hypothetical protein Clacol_002115 [Clathrus columnatus]